MTRYNEYKDSGVQWLGEIPRHWGLRKMKYTFSERSQKGFPNEPLLAATQNHGVIKKSDYENRTVEATKNLDTLKLVEKGDFVISLRSFQGGIEYSYCRGIISPAYTVLKAHHLTEPYFKHLAKSPIFINLLKSTVTGIREGQNIDYNKLKVEFMPIPTLEEQQAIADYLDTATAKIDEAIAQQQKMIDLLNERKQIIINNAVTKGLNPDAPMKDSGVDWIGEIPEHWEVKKLKYVCSFNDEVLPESTENIKIKYVEIGDVDFNDGITNHTEYSFKDAPSRARRITRVNDVIISTVRTYLKAIAKIEENNLIASTGFAVLRAKEINSSYLSYALMNESFVSEVLASSSGVSYPAITASALSSIPIAIPPIEEQIVISNCLLQKCSIINSNINIHKQQISLLQERKQIIINDVVTGKVKVTK